LQIQKETLENKDARVISLAMHDVSNGKEQLS
jgi:hypothetical protein